MKTSPQEILIKQLIKTDIKNQRVLNKVKRKISKDFKISFSSNVELLKTYHKLIKNKRIKPYPEVENLLKTRPVRSLSGIVNISVLTRPMACPGQCIFCPIENGFPKSYLAGEPAADRAKALNFDPYLQVQTRLKMLEDQGHPTDKIELRIVGGTWSVYPKKYQTWFVRRCFQAANEQSSKCKIQNADLFILKTAVHQIDRKLSLMQLQKQNERAKNRIVGLSIETRSDFITPQEILRLRKLGVTLVEMGIQTVFNDIHKKCQTNLTAEKIAQATKLLKDAGFKILYQVMPNLPGSNIKRDLKMFEVLFNDERFKPDWLKIYPCLVCKNTKLHKWWKKGIYKPYSEKQLIPLLIEIKKTLPYWTRLTRLFRDIPAQKIMAGCKTSNIREIIQLEMNKQNLKCHCIRCREIREKYDFKEKPHLFRQDYSASIGKEIFLTFENKKRTKLFSLLRLRIPFNSNESDSRWFIPVLQGTAIIREIQTFGPQLPISKNVQSPALNISAQHKGLGKKLIKQAEKITKKEFGLSKLAVISGIGARPYYKKLGYKLKNSYMIKNLY